jgi:hypothetical protein
MQNGLIGVNQGLASPGVKAANAEQTVNPERLIAAFALKIGTAKARLRRRFPI